MISISNIRKRLLTVVQLQGFHPDREVVAVATVNLVLPEVLRLIKEAVSGSVKSTRRN